ncbi:MAG: hypothetical protein R3284_12995 [Rubricoccaceae bacterium]|nr:hypothetical protein [Rubricoccaceae bacterium]
MTDHKNPPPPDESSARSKRPWTILGRLAHAVREQNWFAVVLEVFIVVLGVVIGFQITAWGNERDLRDREAVQLEALREDFIANREQLKRTLSGQESTVGRQRELLRVMHGHSPRPDSDSLLAPLVFSAVTFHRFEPVLGAYEAMLSAGDLRLIRDPELRSNLAHFAEMAETGWEDEEQITMLRVRLIDFLGEHGDILSIVYTSWREGTNLPVSSMTMDYDALLTSHEFASLAANMAFGEAQMLNYYRRMEEHLDAILAGLGVEPEDGDPEEDQ